MRQSRVLVMVGLLVALSLPSLAHAQTVSCSGVPNYNPAAIYNPGDRVVFNGKLYQANIQIWNAPPDYCPACGYWTLLGTCGGGGGDTTPPATSIMAPASGSTVSGTLTVNASASDNVGVSRVELRLDGAVISTDTAAPYSFAWNTATASNGGHTLSTRAFDAAGNSATSAGVSVTVSNSTGGDTTPPTTSITAPASGATVSGNVTFSASASDNVGVTRVEFRVDGTVIATDTTAPYSITWNTTTAANGSRSLTSRAWDAAGNNRISASRTVNVQNTTPPPGNRLLVGYWHNWGTPTSIRLRDVNPNWDVINVSFAEPVSGSTSNMTFTPFNASVEEFRADIATLKSRGKRVLIAVGGANAIIRLNTTTQRDQFANSMINIVNTYGFSGMDIDIENGTSLVMDGGDLDFRSPTTPATRNVIAAIRTVCDRFGSGFVLSMAPETFYVQVGYEVYGGTAGAYLPIIHGLRDKLSWIHVQHYNTGPVRALDNRNYSVPSADFHVAMSEMLLVGFPVGGNASRVFGPLRQDQVLFGVPATPNAGGGYSTPAIIKASLDYLIHGIRPSGAAYTSRGRYSSFRGVMSWSINWDASVSFSFSNDIGGYLDRN
jgi:chitinase